MQHAKNYTHKLCDLANCCLQHPQVENVFSFPWYAPWYMQWGRQFFQYIYVHMHAIQQKTKHPDFFPTKPNCVPGA